MEGFTVRKLVRFQSFKLLVPFFSGHDEPGWKSESPLTRSYVYLVGRTARARREGYAITFVTDNDRSLLKAIVIII
ncbi:hypothetical protein JHK87_035064 [Glycine soja]|nr:hypothetical protein JHK87_035064 [Glycine soja]